MGVIVQVGRLVGTVSSTVASGNLNYNGLLAIKNLIEKSQMIRSMLKLNIAADYPDLSEDVKTIKYLVPSTLVNLTLAGVGIYLNGPAIQQIALNTLGIQFQKEWLAINFVGTILMATGETVVGRAARHTIGSTFKTLRDVFSLDNVSPILSNEGFLKRTVKIIKSDMEEVPHHFLTAVLGIGILLAGNAVGGTSISANIFNTLKAQIL